MVWGHQHRPRFSYSRDVRPSGVFSYSPAFWGREPSPAMAARARARGEREGRDQAVMVGGAVLGIVAVGALIWIAAKD